MALVRRTQSRIDQATLENEVGKWEDARSGELIQVILRRPFGTACDRLGEGL